MTTDIFELALQALRCCSFSLKQTKVAQLSEQINTGKFDCYSKRSAVVSVADPGRPCLPILVHPTQVPRRRLGSVAGRTGLIHAIAHIEFNAVNLALDAIYRFRNMPPEYYQDWIRVASEEAVHFSLLNNRLRELSSQYGCLPAHGGMWSMAVETDYDVMVRMALVPRVLEARGLDVTPAMITKLSAVGDTETVAILQRILAEEVDHVRIGNRWFKSLCEQRDLDALETFSQLLRKHGRIALRGPFNRPARIQAGFTEAELAEIANLELEFKSQLLEHSQENSPDERCAAFKRQQTD